MTNGVTFTSIEPRHYSIAERETKLAESIEIDLNLVDADDAALCLAAEAILARLRPGPFPSHRRSFQKGFSK